MEDFQIIKKLGNGGLGIIYLVKDPDDNVKALKMYKEEADCDELEDASHLSLKLEHSNLMKCYNYFYDRIVTEKNRLRGKSTVHLFTVLEYIPGETLSNIIEERAKSNKLASMPKKLNIYLPQLISALNYLHSLNIIHRDVKAENIIVNNHEIKLIDYDFLVNNNKDIAKKRYGTPLYLSPELLVSQYYDEKVDMWALGVTIYFCLKNTFPYMAENKSELKKKILSDFIPDCSNFPLNYVRIIRGLLTKNPEQRMNLVKVLEILNSEK